MRWSFALFASLFFLFSCSKDPALQKIEYGPPVLIEAVLAESSIIAGEITDVTCTVSAAVGYKLENPDGFSLYVEPVAGLRIDDLAVGGSMPGEYEIRCAFEGMGEGIEQIADRLTIEHAEPHQIELHVSPDKEFYNIGDEVTLEVAVFDLYGNKVEGLDSLLDWSLPSSGITGLTRGYMKRRFFFDADGEYRVFASIGAPYLISTHDRVLICDSNPPVIALTSPKRGENLDGGFITVEGSVRDELSGVASLTVNGVSVSVSSNSSFSTEIDATHGLNHIRVIAVDTAGHSSEASTSVYHSSNWLPLGTNSAEDAVPEGVGLHLSQSMIDSDSRNCSKGVDGVYACQEYKDIASMVELLLNNLDLEDKESMQIFDFGPYHITESRLRNESINLGKLLGSRLDYKIAGSFVLNGEYSITGNVVSIDIADTVLGDKQSGILGLQAANGGLDMLAYVRSGQDGEDGAVIFFEIRVDFDFTVTFSVDKRFSPNNGVWRNKNGADVTARACEPGSGYLAIADALMGFIGANANFFGYICENDPMVSFYPSVYTGASVAVDSMRISGRLDFDITPDHWVEVNLRPMGENPVIAILGESVRVESDEDIIIDLDEVSAFNGLFTVDLGKYNVGSPLRVLDPILSFAGSFLRDRLTFAFDDLFFCQGDRADCHLNVETLVEDIFNSIIERDKSTLLPAVMPNVDDMKIDMSQYFQSIRFNSDGAWIGLNTALTTTRSLSQYIPEPRGALLRGTCLPGDTISALTAGSYMSASVDLDLVNQALLTGWYNGGLSGKIDIAPSNSSIDSISMSFQPLVPPVVTACTGESDQLELHFGAVFVDLNVDISGSWVSAQGYSDLRYVVDAGGTNSNVKLELVGGAIFNEFEITESSEDLGAYSATISDIIGSQIMPDILKSFVDATLSAIRMPSILLGDDTVPGLGADVELEFSISQATRKDAAIVVNSD